MVGLMIKETVTSKEIAERCLNNYWNSCATDFHGGGWDNGSPAWYFAIKWSQRNFVELRLLSWREIYKRYRKSLVQE